MVWRKTGRPQGPSRVTQNNVRGGIKITLKASKVIHIYSLLILWKERMRDRKGATDATRASAFLATRNAVVRPATQIKKLTLGIKKTLSQMILKANSISTIIEKRKNNLHAYTKQNISKNHGAIAAVKASSSNS